MSAASAAISISNEPYQIPLKEDAVPVYVSTPRRVPHPALAKAKSRLRKMGMEVIFKVTEPFERCAGMVPVPKSSGEVPGLPASKNVFQQFSR